MTISITGPKSSPNTLPNISVGLVNTTPRRAGGGDVGRGDCGDCGDFADETVEGCVGVEDLEDFV